MGSKELLAEALKLKPDEKFMMMEGILKSLDEPDKTIDNIWIEEAEQRLQAYRQGKLSAIPMEQIFSEE